VLLAGVSYTVAGYGFGPTFDPYVRPPAASVSMGSGIDFVRYRSEVATGLAFPGPVGDVGDRTVFFGSTFRYTVPAPSAAAMLLGAGGMFCIRRRR